MNILLLGASGGVGRHVVDLAVERGYRVTVYARPETALTLDPSVSVVRGRLDDGQGLAVACRGMDVVLSTIGMQRKNPKNPWSASVSEPDLCERAAERIVTAMRESNVRRVVAVSAAGVGDSAGRLNVVMRFFLATTMIGDAYRDLARMEEVFARSGVDWLAPRPTRLTDAAAAEHIAVVDSFGARDDIARRDVARWMLNALELPQWPDPAWGTRTPQISRA